MRQGIFLVEKTLSPRGMAALGQLRTLRRSCDFVRFVPKADLSRVALPTRSSVLRLVKVEAAPGLLTDHYDPRPEHRGPALDDRYYHGQRSHCIAKLEDAT